MLHLPGEPEGQETSVLQFTGAEGALRVLVPVEEFVVTFNEKAQSERTEWGTKDKKNLDDVDISNFEDVTGTDHHKFDSSVF